MDAKRFCYVCAGILLLVAAYGLGANKVQGQAAGSEVVTASATGSFGSRTPEVYVTKANGEIWLLQVNAGGTAYSPLWTQLPSVPGGPIQVESKTWGAVKESFKE